MEVTWPTPISVEERLPETADDVLVRVTYPFGYSGWQVSCFGDDDWWVDSEHGGNSVVMVVKEEVTHWLPLPPAP
jgi:hypothetical protein